MRRYREAVDNTDSGWGKMGHYTEAIRTASQTGDTAFVSEMRAAVVKSLSEESDAFNGSATDNAARLTFAVGRQSPDMCRYYLEAAMKDTLTRNPDRDDAIWLIRGAIEGMALIDPQRALEMVRDLPGANNQIEGRLTVIRALLTPPTRWDTLVNDQNVF
ncbi:MAG: hypothetical protein EOO77_45320 [Oxalobacteraceae bacterium]|nr:MAG: hypothetical protein EOO77_45320 [Oxalobacteraceae bacterium]